MYHPSRGGVRGGRDQFNWDDVKVDKHRENYLGHSIKAPVGRWQRGKDLHWYVKNEKGGLSKEDAAKAEIARIKAEEDQAMREALGLAPARDTRTQGSRLDKHEVAELLKRGKTAEELPDNYTEAERVQGLGFAPVPGHKKAFGYEKGAQLAGVQPEADLDQSDKPNEPSPVIPENGVDMRKTKEEKSEAKEKRKQEKKAAKLARKEEKKHKKEHSDDRKERHKERHSRSGRGEDSPSHKRHRRRHDSDSD